MKRNSKEQLLFETEIFCLCWKKHFFQTKKYWHTHTQYVYTIWKVLFVRNTKMLPMWTIQNQSFQRLDFSEDAALEYSCLCRQTQHGSSLCSGRETEWLRKSEWVRKLQGAVSSPSTPTQSHKGTPAQNVHCIPSSTHLMKAHSFRATNKNTAAESCLKYPTHRKDII